jgi:hypothetical protein
MLSTGGRLRYLDASQFNKKLTTKRTVVENSCIACD